MMACAGKSHSPHGEYLFSKRYSLYVFSLLFLLYLFDFADRQVVVALFPYLKRDWGLTDTECGLLISAVYWTIVLFSLPVSILIDRWSRRRSIGIMAILWSLATGACAFTTSFPQLLAVRAAIGLGEAGYAPGGTALISALFPERQRSTFIGLWNAAIPLGSAIGILAGGAIAARWGWRHAFGVVAVPGFVVALLFYFTRDYQTVKLVALARGESAQPAHTPLKTIDIVGRFARTYSLLFALLGLAANMFLSTALMSWLPTYLHRVGHLSEQAAAQRGSLVLIMAIIGSPLGGFLADLWLKTKANARLVFCAISSVITAILFVVAFGVLSGPLQYGVLLVGGVSASLFGSSAIAATQDVVHPGLRATAYSFCVVVLNLLGSSLGPLVAGYLSDKFGIATSLTVVSLAPLAAAVLFAVGSVFYVTDVAQVERVALRAEE